MADPPGAAAAAAAAADGSGAPRRRRNRVDDGSEEDAEEAQYELTGSEEEGDTEAEEKHTTPQAQRATVGSKRKRESTTPDEDEITRRRRRRRSLKFQLRRKSLTPSTKAASGNGGGAGAAGAPPAKSRQYISDMYSTIIKMSSENKINVKNSWSLHLIDHMEDILDSSKKGAGEEDAESADDTYNFQKASCTLDASIKIYSYRVDDTWNSSYKILENLSRTEEKHGTEDAVADDSAQGGGRARKTRKTHARTIEKNLNNINLKSFDMECEADPLFHKMSQSFDEGGAKGMLLANLSVYDGCKILLNSSDVSVATRKPLSEKVAKKEDVEQQQETEESAELEAIAEEEGKAGGEVEGDKAEEDGVDDEAEGETNGKAEGDDEDKAEAEVDTGDKSADVVIKAEVGTELEVEAETETKANETTGGKADDEEEAKDEDNEIVEATEVAKEAEKEDSKALEDTSDEILKEKPAASERISLSCFGNLSCLEQDVQDLSVCPPLFRLYDQLDEYYGDDARHKVGIKTEFLEKTPVKGRRQRSDKRNSITMNLGSIMEDASGEESDADDNNIDASVDFDDNGGYEGDADGNDTAGEGEEVPGGEAAEDVDMENEIDAVDLTIDDIEEDGELVHEGSERDSASVLNSKVALTGTASDFFRAKEAANNPQSNQDANLFSQMIESALMRSATLEDDEGGEDPEGKNDYSYFDVKMLRNWAGPAHWKFPAVRKVQNKLRTQGDMEKDGEENGEEHEDGVVIKTEGGRRPSGSGASSGVDKKATAVVDFFADEPDLASLLKPPASSASLELSKFYVNKQLQNATDLVFPVDTHIEIGLFFQHFLKGKERFFRKPGSRSSDNAPRDTTSGGALEFSGATGDTPGENDGDESFGYNDDSGGFEGSYDYDDDDGTSGGDDTATDAMYSTEGLVTADRVVNKIGVHFERFAKRVDVKKLKGSIWDYLEKDVISKGKKIRDKASSTADSDETVEKNESGKRPREPDVDEEGAAATEELDTNFESVVESIADKVPSNVTVSFYFICMLHLANEKGLELKGQDDLRNFQIRKEAETQ